MGHVNGSLVFIRIFTGVIMAIFPKLLTDKTVQIEDMFRLDSRRTSVSKNEAAVTLVEIEPESGDGFVDVTGTSYKEWFLDWQYSGLSRTVVASVRVTTDGTPVTFTQSISVLIEADDMLFSDDQDLLSKEEDILKWLPKDSPRTSFKYKHRQAQTEIVEDFNERGVEDFDRDRLTKEAFVDRLEVQQWSLNLTLSLIFRDNSNLVGDLYDQKANEYFSQAMEHRDAFKHRLDLDGDGIIDKNENVPYRTGDLVRT